MNAKEADQIIERFLGEEKTNGNDYIIDFVPITFPDADYNKDYPEFQEYLDKHYKSDFAEKIIFIAFTIIFYYDSSIWFDDTFSGTRFDKLQHKDLRYIGLEKLAKIIRILIMENRTGLNILFKNNDQISLFRIEDGYDKSFFNLSDEAVPMIKSLVDHEGLYLKKIKM